MKPRAWINPTTGDLPGNHPISRGYDPSEWEPLYTLDQMRECVPPKPTPSYPGLASCVYDEGLDDCRNITLDALDALMKAAK